MSPQVQGSPQDEQAIRTMATQFIAAWSRNDGKALGAFFTTDGDLINPAGRIARGRNEVERLLNDEQNGLFKGTRLTMPLKYLRFLKPDLAVADYEFEVTGGTHLKGLITSVLRKEGDRWLIASARPMVPVQLPS